MHLRDVRLLAGKTFYENPFVAYGICGDADRPFQLQQCDSGILADEYNVMIARADRMLFAGNGPHVGFEHTTDPEADVREGRIDMFHYYGRFFEPEILHAWLDRLQGAIPPLSLAVTFDRDVPVVTFSAGIVKQTDDSRGPIHRPEKYVMTAQATIDFPCRGFSTHELLNANNNGFAPHMPIKKYEISGVNSHEIASSLYESLGESALATCAAVFDGYVWNMEAINKGET